MKPAETVESILERHRALVSGSLLSAERRAELKDGREAARELERSQRQRLEERLQATRAARERATARFDSEIARLERQLDQLDRATEPPELPSGPGGRKRPAGRPAVPVEKVTGVGRALGKRLEEASYRDAAAIARAAPEKLAEAIGVTVDQAKKLVANARELVGR